MSTSPTRLHVLFRWYDEGTQWWAMGPLEGHLTIRRDGNYDLEFNVPDSDVPVVGTFHDRTGRRPRGGKVPAVRSGFFVRNAIGMDVSVSADESAIMERWANSTETYRAIHSDD